NPCAPTTYTALWLDSLSKPPDRLSYATLEPGTVLANGRYHIIGPIGAGGQGTVYSATHKEDTVVVKEFVLPAQGGIDASRSTLDHISREADLLRKLNNDKIVKLIDFFVEDFRAYLVMEHVEGISLRALVEMEGPQPEGKVRDIGLQMCEILSYLHSQS